MRRKDHKDFFSTYKMHQTARENFLRFLHRYQQLIFTQGKVPRFLDVGSYNVNGTLKEDLIKFANEKGFRFEYIGMDMVAGNNVDVVNTSDDFPFGDGSFDVVVSSSCFEHDPCFWMTFKEMVRVLKRAGLMYIQAPAATPYHAYPIDCWRFFEDSWRALEKWCKNDVRLNESYIDHRLPDRDSVGIYMRK